ncbi:MAG: VWA domain-containing protein, partial [Chloroflexi bacterium]|nr:VWA domain-containing protein [Chloroflexota bacterium]
GFMALSVPLVTGLLSFSGTLSKDSRTKATILQGQYSAQGCTQQATYKLKTDSSYVASLSIGVPDVYSFDGCTITITLVSGPQASKVAFADLVITLDVEGSVDALELVDLKQAANTIVDAFSLETTDGRIRIGVLRFANSSASVVDMTDVDEHGVSEPLHDGINGIVRGGPGLGTDTNLVAALNGTKQQFNTGLGDRTDPPYPVPNLVVFITDSGDAAGNSIGAIQGISAGMGGQGTTIFAIGVGSAITMPTLNAIATAPANVFTTADFSALLDIIGDIVTAVYDAAGMGTLFTIESVSPDGTVSISEYVIPPP